MQSDPYFQANARAAMAKIASPAVALDVSAGIADAAAAEHQGDEHQGDEPDGRSPVDAREYAELVAGLVLEGLEGSVVPSAIPREVGEEIATFTSGNAYFHELFVPLGPWGIRFMIRFMPDGSMQVELRSAQDYRFWQGVFRPVGGPCEARSRW